MAIEKTAVAVLFDTNAIWSRSASELVSNEARRVLESYGSDPDYSFQWLLPSVVVHERTYQMRLKAVELALRIPELETLLDRNLGCEVEQLGLAVDRQVEAHCRALRLERVELALDAVKWENVVLDSLYRRPPFEPDKEKGFRDALVVATAAQVFERLPDRGAGARLVVVTNDALMTRALESGFGGSLSAHVVAGLGAFEGLVRELRTREDLKWVSRARKKADELLYDDSLWEREKLVDRLHDGLSAALRKLPNNAERAHRGEVEIDPTEFVKREAGRMYWKTRVHWGVTAWKKELDPRALAAAFSRLGLSIGEGPVGLAAGLTPSSQVQSRSWPGWVSQTNALPWLNQPNALTLSTPGPSPKEILVASGNVTVEMHWSVAVDHSEGVTDLKIEGLSEGSARWDQ